MGIRYFEHEELYGEVLVKGLALPEKSLWLATANLKQTLVEHPSMPGRFRPVVEAFAELASRGVEVRLLHSGEPSKPFAESLRRSRALEVPGFDMRRCPRVHFKAMIVDGSSAYVGSANVTGAGLGAKSPDRRNFEVGLWTDERLIVHRLRELFSAVWGGAFCSECGRAGECDRPLARPESAPRSENA